jgi:hypothetical protein
MLELLFLAMDGPATETEPPVVPVIQELRISGDAGVCGAYDASSNASITLRWRSLYDGDLSADHEIRVYKNGVLKDTLDADEQSFTEELENVVVGQTRNQFTTDWLYEVKLVNSTTGAVVGSVSGRWRETYGTCSGTVGGSAKKERQFLT